MRRRELAVLVIALVVAAVCVRLGVWQLRRLEERRAWNATVLAGLTQPVVRLDSLTGTGTGARYRRVVVSGRYDNANELLVANRPRRGSPGVHLLTPLILSGTDTAVLVLRGWVYAPDAASADRERWREDTADSAVGYVQLYDANITGQRAALHGRILRRLSYAAVTAAMPYPVAPYLVVLTDTADTGEERPPRLDEPVLGEGSHLSYAFQWFAFAVIALAGTAVYLKHSRRGRDRDEEPLERR